MKVYTFLTDGFETVEALAVIDILRRAGIEVETVSITGNEQVCSAQNITVKADTLFKAQPVCKEDVLFLPGGPGHKQYNECKRTDCCNLCSTEYFRTPWHIKRKEGNGISGL